MRKCTKCGREFSGDVKFCPSCGEKTLPLKEVKFCSKCGAKLEAGARFCGSCGTQVFRPAEKPAEEVNIPITEDMEIIPEKLITMPEETATAQEDPEAMPEKVTEAAAVPGKAIVSEEVTMVPEKETAGTQAVLLPERTEVLQKPEKTIMMPVQEGQRSFVRKHAKALIGMGTALVVCIGLLLTVVFVKTQGFQKDIDEFQKKGESFASLGKYQDTYDECLEESQSMAAHFAVWNMDAQKTKMEGLCQEIQEMNDQVAGYREEYEAVVKELETSGRYLLSDYELEYQRDKKSFQSALEEFDIEKSKEESEKFQDLQLKIQNHNKEKGTSFLDEMLQGKKDYSYYSCESYLIDKLRNSAKKYFDEKNYTAEQEEYNQCKDLIERMKSVSASYDLVDGYSQVDVSKPGEVSLYLQTDQDNVNWNQNRFLIYEQAGKNDEKWKQCALKDIAKVEEKGQLTIDIVADVSTSMDDNYGFYNVVDTVASFAESVGSNTNLGLAEISSIYTRRKMFTNDKDEVVDAIYDLECHGTTALYHSLYSSVVYTASSTGERCVVAFTDGVNEPYDDSYDYSEYDVVDAAKAYHVPVYIIGMGYGVDSSALEYITEETGGQYWSIYDLFELEDVYDEIYEEQLDVYQLTYASSVKNNKNRLVYVSYYDNDNELSVCFQKEIDAKQLQQIYTTVSADDLGSYYSETKLLTTEEVDQIDDLEDLQTIINIYYARNGYQFQNKTIFNQLKATGAVKKNGTIKDTSKVEKKMKKKKRLYKNYRTLIKRRSAIYYDLTWEVYEPGMSKKEVIRKVHDMIGESNKVRYAVGIGAAYKSIKKEW